MAKRLKQAIQVHVEKAWKTVTPIDAHKFFGAIYRRISPKGHGSRNWNGLLLEELIVKFLGTKISEDCIFRNKKLALIDDTKYDILLCSSNIQEKTQSPICLSVKTSLRERYKQAEREGLTAKQVHLGSYTVLLTMDKKVVEKKGRIMRGLDMVVDCSNEVQLRIFLEKIVSLNPIPCDQIKEIGPLISGKKTDDHLKRT
jgi:hypothetical protein